MTNEPKSTLERGLQILKAAYATKFSSLEQYLFGFSGTVMVMCTNEERLPFYVLEWDLLNKLTFRRRFDGRTEANKFATELWLKNFK